MDIRGLHYFITAAERLNFTSAAKECYITQTAMSLHISKMEDELGFKLFTRGKKAVELTEAGKDFYKRALSVLEHYERSVRCSTSISEGMTGIINIMIPSCIEGFVFMDKFREFRTKYPEVEFNVLVEPPDRLIRNIKNGKVDIGFGAPDDMEIDPDFCVARLREDPVALICSMRHRFAKLDFVTSDMLRGERIVVCEPRGMPMAHKKIRNDWALAGFEPDSFLVVNNMDEMLIMTELERGIALLPGFVSVRISPETAGVAFIECRYEGATPTMTTAIGYLCENENPALQKFLSVLLGD